MNNKSLFLFLLLVCLLSVNMASASTVSNSTHLNMTKQVNTNINNEYNNVSSKKLLNNTKTISTKTDTDSSLIQTNNKTVLNNSNVKSLTKTVTNVKVIYVSPYGDDYTGTGSYNNPYGTIFKGLRAAPSGGTVTLLPGTYDILGTTNHKSITLSKDVTITANPSNTRIDLGEYDNNVFIIPEDIKVTMKGLVFSNNKVQELLTNYGTLSLTNCIFSNNGIIDSHSDYDAGGVLYNNEGTVNINNCQFIKNTGNYFGGAIEDFYGKITIKNSIFKNNTVSDPNLGGAYGGAIALRCYGNCNIYGCTFIGNYAKNWGGAIYSFRNNLVISNSVFTSNKANLKGGALLLGGNTERHKVFMKITNTKFTSNKAKEGGAISTSGTYLSVTGSSFINNIGTGSAISYEYNNGDTINFITSINNNYWGSTNPKWTSLLKNVHKPSTWKKK